MSIHHISIHLIAISAYDGCTQRKYHEPAAMLLLPCIFGNGECVVFDTKKNGNDNNRNSNNSNKDNNNYQLDMSSVIFDSVDYFMDSSANNCENTDVGDIAINFNIRNGDMRCIGSGDVTISQLCGHSNVNGMYIICDGQEVATLIKGKIHVEFASQLDVLHLSNTSIRNKDCEFIANYYGYSQSEAAQLSYPLTAIETKTQLLAAVNVVLENTSTINEIKRLEHIFNVSVTDGHNVSSIIAKCKSNNFIFTTNAAENVKNVDFWSSTQILHVKYCNDNKNKNNYHVSR